MRRWIVLGLALGTCGASDCGPKRAAECSGADCDTTDSAEPDVVDDNDDDEDDDTTEDPVTCEITDQTDGTTTVTCSDSSTIALSANDTCAITNNNDGTSDIDCDDGTSTTVTATFDCTTTDNLDTTGTLACPGLEDIVLRGAVGPTTECTVNDNLDSTFTVSCTDGPEFTVDWNTNALFGTLAPGESLELDHGLADSATVNAAQFETGGTWRDRGDYGAVFSPFIGSDIALVDGGHTAFFLGDQIPMAELANGNAAVFWVSDPGVDATFNVHVLQRDGTVVGSVLDFDTDDGNNGNNAGGMGLAALDGGDFVVAWVAGDDAEVKLQRFDNTPSAQGATIDLVATRTAFIGGEIDIAPLDDGGFAVAYFLDDADDRTVRVDEFDATGTYESTLATFVSIEDPQRFVNLIRPSTGLLALARGNDAVAEEEHVWVHWIDQAGIAATINTDLGAQNVDEVSLTADGDGNAIVGWEDKSTGSIEVSTVQPDGSVVVDAQVVDGTDKTSAAVIGWDDGEFTAVWSTQNSESLSMQTFGADGSARADADDFNPADEPVNFRPLRSVLRWDETEAWVSMKPEPEANGNQILRISRNILTLVHDDGADDMVDTDNGATLTNHGDDTVDVLLTSSLP